MIARAWGSASLVPSHPKTDLAGDTAWIGFPTADAMSLLKSLPSYRRAIDSEDATEGQAAFTERRAPIWKNR